MKRLRRSIVLGLLAFGCCNFAVAADSGSADEAVAMVKKAVAYLNAHGKTKAYAEFMNPNGQFKHRDLYVAVLDTKGITQAHGGNAKMVGKEILDLRDVDGTYFVKKFFEVANAKGNGWVEYKWPNPISKAIEQKATYVEKVDDVLIVCGVYKR